MIGKILVSLGITFRSVVLISILLGALLAGVGIELFSYTEKLNIFWYIALGPFIFFFLVLVSALCSSSRRKHLKDSSNKITEEDSAKVPHQSVIAIACYGTYIALAILLACFLILFGLQKHLPVILGVYILFGWIAVFKVMWPFFERKMKP